MKATTMQNEEGQQYSLADLAARGVGNKAVRRGELMLRMAGCEEIANELGHVGVFLTITCPSAYHAVLAKSGTANPKYNNKNPRQAQGYLMDVWKCFRAKNSRDGLRPYGFRIAEPHHDSCPHWHVLVFLPREQLAQLEANLYAYALAEDGDEPGAEKNRVKIVRIEAGKGTAAGYIAKYVGKNIDDEHVDTHIDEDGSVIETDLVGDQVIRPCQRVEAWAACWGIRQFQAMGQPPVTAWRELRRVERAKVEGAPQHVQDAWAACQRDTEVDPETGEVTVTHAASWAAYVRAQGGVNKGRDYRIAIHERLAAVEGRYGLAERMVPAGVICRSAPATVYASTRHTWKRVGVAVAVGVAVPWTRVNNCTVDAEPKWLEFAGTWEYIAPFDHTEYYADCDFSLFDTDPLFEHKKFFGAERARE